MDGKKDINPRTTMPSLGKLIGEEGSDEDRCHQTTGNLYGERLGAHNSRFCCQ